MSWSASGARRWTSSYTAGGVHEVVPLDLVVAADRSLYASGFSRLGSDTTAMTVRYSVVGKTLWKKTYAGTRRPRRDHVGCSGPSGRRGVCLRFDPFRRH